MRMEVSLIEIRFADPSRLNDVVKLAMLLWPDNDEAELKLEFENILEDEKATVLLAVEEDLPIGFAHCQIRSDYVEGTSSSPVGYLEGIYVVESYRHKGVARKLLKGCEDWVRSKGLVELASDCELTNKTSIAFHEKLGFKESNRVVCFVKDIDE